MAVSHLHSSCQRLTAHAAHGSPCSWRSGPVAVVAKRVHHQSSAANGFGRSPSVATAQGSRDISAPGPQDLPAPPRVPRSRLAPSRIGPSCRLVHRPGRGQWCCILGPRTGETQATGPPGSKAPERLETALITQLTRWTPRGHGSRPVSHRLQLGRLGASTWSSRASPYTAPKNLPWHLTRNPMILRSAVTFVPDRHRWPFRHRDGGRSTKYVLNYPN